MENDERMEIMMIQRVHHVLDVGSVEFEFSALFQIEVGICESNVCSIDDDIEGRERREKLFECVELVSSREGSI